MIERLNENYSKEIENQGTRLDLTAWIMVYLYYIFVSNAHRNDLTGSDRLALKLGLVWTWESVLIYYISRVNMRNTGASWSFPPAPRYGSSYCHTLCALRWVNINQEYVKVISYNSMIWATAWAFLCSGELYCSSIATVQMLFTVTWSVRQYILPT